MKPLYLEIEGVKSVSEKQTVNFERVAKSGIFGVFGKTGSGKTTILDSIVLALYGDVTNSVGNKDFVNTGCNRARVMLTFSVQENGERVIYKAERVYKFDKKRENLTSSAYLSKIVEGEEYPIAENTKQVNEKIENEIIGLDKKDFLKCIALPQGAFSDFIKQTRSLRLSFVGKLFGLEKYGKPLADKITLKDRILNDKQNQLIGESSALEGFDENYLQESKKQLDAITEELDKATKELNAEKERFEGTKELYRLCQDRQKKREERSKKLAYMPVIEGYRREIEIYDNALFAKKEIDLYLQSQQTIALVEKNIADFNKEKETLGARRIKVYNEFKNIPQMQEDLALLISKKELSKGIAEKMDWLEGKNKELVKERDEYKKLTLEKLDLTKRKEEALKEESFCLKKAEEFNTKQALSLLANKLSLTAVNEYASQQLDFLNELLARLKEEKLPPESAVNRLIDQQIEKIKVILVKKTDEIGVDALNECICVIENNQKFIAKAQKAKEVFVQAEANLNSVEEKMQQSLKRGKTLKEESELYQTEVNAFLQGKSFEQAKNDTELAIKWTAKKIDEINKEFESINEELNSSAIKIAQYEADLANARKINKESAYDLENKLTLKGITLENAIAILKESERIEKNRAVEQAFAKELTLLESAIGELNEKLKDISVSEEDYEKSRLVYISKEENCIFINKKFGEIKRSYDIGLKNNENWCIINKKLAEIKGERAVLSKVLTLVKESRFMEFIAEVYLREIAKEAEARVLSLTSGKYGLVYKNGNFFVIDNLQGGRERPVLSLSGGETFLVSLSLALALSAQISRRASKPLEFFFLDEGFGTLDDELIDAVTTSLEKLQKSNLTVGLITHVAELKNRIGAKIEVTGATALHGTLISDNG